MENGYYDLDNRIEEVEIPGNSIEKVNSFLLDTCKSICKIITSTNIGTGFLIKFFKGNSPFNCLLTCEHVITKDIINSETIDVYYNNQRNKFEINLQKEKRVIHYYSFIEIDAVSIEILPKDNIYEYFFLSANLNYISDFNKLENTEICIVQFPEGRDLSYSYGKISSITNNEFKHTAPTKPGSSGSPIFLKGIPSVIGIHKQGQRMKIFNFGNFIGPIFKILKINTPLITKKYGYGKYEGTSENNKKNGYGKFIYENGEVYSGEWENGLKNGEGIEFFKNKKIKYVGGFKNG